ncbi:hypothetical protein F993_01493 [Acinetobacter proteolyticus]|uniref:DUF1833 domain-containing protein n=1 Tax=Acinetobacter proteolyticus TaxID=1776741 RepID=A0ABN0JGG7_9GAMM|nr:hypothetical protein [Acinetobacter proteolyticus]ENU24177.1 hypothetical protein F993_01493 [Acinetobacter proteolyticus]
MADYTSFYLNASSGVVPLECIEISHPSFSKVFRYVKNDSNGIVAEGQNYVYQPMSIKRNDVSNDLEQKLSLTIADMDDELALAVLAIRESIYSTVKPECKFKLFRDDDLTAPMTQLQTLEIPTISKDSSGLVTFDAQAPQLNSVKTGQTYSIEDYPLLRRA